MDPEAQRNNKRVLDIALCLFLPSLDGILLPLLLSEGELEEPLDVC